MLARNYQKDFEDDILEIEIDFSQKFSIKPQFVPHTTGDSITLYFKSRFSLYNTIFDDNKKPLLRLKSKPFLNSMNEAALSCSALVFEQICQCFQETIRDGVT